MFDYRIAAAPHTALLPGYYHSQVFSRLRLEVGPHLLFQFAVELIPPHVEEQLAPEF
jgi:hypothetical protein